MEEIGDSILLYVKKMLGILPEYKHFDADLIGLINAEFAKLHQLGVGTSDVYSITGDSENWSEFMESNDELSMVKTFLYMSVRLAFDPPNSSAVFESFTNRIAELEWRLQVSDDRSFQNDKTEGEDDDA